MTQPEPSIPSRDPRRPPLALVGLLRPLREPGFAARMRSGLREFVILAAGVLAALAAQAWWEGRQERARERDYLRQLLADTRENERRLARAIAVDSSAGAVIGRTIGALYGSAPPPSVDSLVAWFTGGVFSSSDFRLLSGTYDALEATGDLRLIRTDSLRAKLVAYAATQSHERMMLHFFLQQSAGDPSRLGRALPFLRRIFDGGSEAVLADARLDRVDPAALRTDREVGALLFTAQAANQNRLNHLRALADETRELRVVIEAERGVSRR